MMSEQTDARWDSCWSRFEKPVWPEYWIIRVEWFRNQILKFKESDEFKNNVIVEIGAGTGLVTKELASLLTDTTYYCTDISKRALESIDELKLPNVQTIETSELLQEGPIADMIICGEVVEHVEDRSSFFEMITSIIKPGGYLLLTTPNRYMPGMYLNLLLGREATGQPYDRPLNKKELIELVSRYDFEVISCNGKRAEKSQVIQYRSFLRKVARETLLFLVKIYLGVMKYDSDHCILLIAKYNPTGSTSG